jgi:hypothetical protein
VPQIFELEARCLLAASAQPTAADIAFVTNLYETVLFREPTADDVAHWMGYLARGVSERAITRIVLHGQERAGLVTALGVDLGGTPQQFVDSLYTSLLDRPPDASGEASWIRAVRKGADHERIVQEFLEAGDFPGVATSVVLGASPTETIQGGVVTLTAVVAPKAGSLPATGSVEFFNGAALVATASASGFQAVATTTALPPGTDAITAVYLGDSHYQTSTSQAVTVQVLRTSTTAIVASPASPTFGDPLTLTATVSASGVTPTVPGGAPTGSVEFFDGSTDLGPGTLSDGTARLITSALAPGAHALTASYLGDGGFAASTSQAITVRILRASTTTIDASPDSTTFGDPVTLTATVTGSGATPTGTVEFFDGATDLGPGTLSGGTAMLTTSALAGGSHALTAAYQGDSIYAASTSAAATVMVAQAGTTTGLTAAPTATTFGSPVLLTATVAASSGSTVPEGTVEFFNGITDLGPGTLSGGKATLTTSSLPITTNQITAAYAGDTNFKASTSPAVSVRIGQSSTTTLNVSPTTATYSNPVALTANVTASGNGIVTGQVEFFDGTTDLGFNDVYQGEAVFVSDTLTGGVHTFTAVYLGDPGNLPSTSAPASATIYQAAAQLSLSADHKDVADGAPVTFTVYVVSSTGNGVPSGNVTFYDGTTPLGTQTLPGVPGQVAKLTTSSLSHGTHTITASYAGDINFGPGTSAPVTVNVGVMGTTTSLAANQTIIPYATDVTLTATVTPDSGTGTPTGTVEFYAGTIDLGSAPLGNTFSPNSAELDSQTIPAGTTSVTAVYKGDNQYGTSTSPPTPLIVVKAFTVVLAKASATSITSGSPVTITAGVRRLVITEPTGATGTVTFSEGSTVLGAVPLDAKYEAVLTTSTLIAPGPHFITVQYSGDANYTESPPFPMIINVGQATTTGLKVVPTSSTYGDPVAVTATIAPASGSGTPTGTVTFESDGAAIDPDVPVSNGVASDTITDIPAGDSTITAVYSGDTTYAGSTSPGVPVSVAKLATTTTLTASAMSSPFGNGVELTANTAAPVLIAAFNGTVTFYAGSTLLGSEPVGNGNGPGNTPFLAFNIPLGADIPLTAVYSGDSNYLGSTSAAVPITITPAPTVTSLAASPISANPGDPVTLTATVTNVGVTLTPPGSADFYDGSTLLGSAPISQTTAEAVFTTTTLASGSHSLTAAYPGSTAFLPSPPSSAVTVNIS